MRQRRRQLRQTTRRPYMMFNCEGIYNITVFAHVMYRDKERYLVYYTTTYYYYFQEDEAYYPVQLGFA